MGEMRGPEIRPSLPRRLFPQPAPPAGDAPVVAGEQDLGDIQPLERPRSRILRMFEQPVLEALVLKRRRRPEHPRDQPHARLDHHHRRRLATGEDRVADGDLLEPAGV